MAAGLGARRPTLRVGTSGWHYRHWVGLFYPARMPPRRFLAHYAQEFDTVEINNVFYRLPAHHIFEEWRVQTPPEFLFACKASRFITHFRKLKPPFENYDRFFNAIEALGDKLGPILFQLPPRWPVDVERLQAFLAWLPGGHRYVFEFRDRSWLGGAVVDALSRRNAAICVYDLAGHQTPPVVTADFAYVRLHGPVGRYQGSYDDEALRHWSEQAALWRAAGHDVFIYFDNDDKAMAVGDARRLRALGEQG